jgi:hypothetical protein
MAILSVQHDKNLKDLQDASYDTNNKIIQIIQKKISSLAKTKRMFMPKSGG